MWTFLVVSIYVMICLLIRDPLNNYYFVFTYKLRKATVRGPPQPHLHYDLFTYFVKLLMYLRLTTMEFSILQVEFNTEKIVKILLFLQFFKYHISEKKIDLVIISV